MKEIWLELKRFQTSKSVVPVEGGASVKQLEMRRLFLVFYTAWILAACFPFAP